MNKNRGDDKWSQSGTGYSVEHIWLDDERGRNVTDAWVVHHEEEYLFVAFPDGFTFWCSGEEATLDEVVNAALDAYARRSAFAPMRRPFSEPS
jgi:hypothetical protein